MDNQHLNRYNPDKQGQYYILDTTLDNTQTAYVPAMNGRIGDTLRTVPLAFTDDGQPHDLTNSDLELRVQDAAGVVKTSTDIVNPVSLGGGLLVFGIPAQFYQAAGEIQHGYFVIKDNDNNSVSTVNVTFVVEENGIDVTKAQSKVYLSQFDELLQSAKEKAESVQQLNDNNEAMVKGYQQLLADNKVAVTSADNDFTGVNTFTTLKVDSLSNAAVDQALADIPTVKEATSNNTADIKSLVSDLEDVKKASSATQSSNASASDVADLSDTVVSNVSAITSLSSANDALSDSVSSIAANFYDLPLSYVTTSKAKALSNDIETNSQALESQSSSITSLSSAVSNNTKQIATVQTSVATEISKIPDTTQLQSDHNTISTLTGSYGAAVAAWRALDVADQAMKVLKSMAAVSSDQSVKTAYSQAANHLSDVDHDWNNDMGTLKIDYQY